MPANPTSPSRAAALKERSKPRPIYKIILLGDSGVGKTSLMRQFTTGKFENRYKATIGADFFTYELEIEGRPVSLQIWDTAGQERFQSLGVAFYRGADACMLVFDITSGESFSHLSQWEQEFRFQSGKELKEIILVGNKTDLEEKRQVFQHGVKEWCRTTATMRGTVDPVNYVETSAKDHKSVKVAFEDLALRIHKSKEGRNGSNTDSQVHELLPATVSLNQKPKKDSNTCPC